MISEIYPRYFQKSFTFLYPILGFKKNKFPRPVQTYVCWDKASITMADRKLVCVYKTEDTEAWKNFEMNHLLTHRMLDYCIPQPESNTVVYIFDFNSMAEDFDAFLIGSYSKLSANFKKLLTDYYGTHTPEWVYIESFLYPSKYFKQYASILSMDVDVLKKVGELCDRLDIDKETCVAEPLLQETNNQ